MQCCKKEINKNNNNKDLFSLVAYLTERMNESDLKNDSPGTSSSLSLFMGYGKKN